MSICFDKPPITFVLGHVWTPNFHRMRQTKLNEKSEKHRPSAYAKFLYSKNSEGEVNIPPPPGIGLILGFFQPCENLAMLHQSIKKDSKRVINNYRPISLLPLFAKILENILFLKMYNHFTSNNLITKNQSGFRPNDSVTNQLICLVDSIHSSLDINLDVRSVFLDISKAFDKVWHEGLLFKLKQNGINGKLLKLLKSYLANRNQRVLLNGSESGCGIVESGVPQGSIRTVVFFNLYK